MPSFEPVTAVSRALDILVAINRHGTITISQLHQETGLHKSTVLRMLETLIHEGFVTRLTEGRGYTVTGKCSSLSRGFKASNALVRVSSPFLSQFRRDTGWPADIAIFDQDAMFIPPADQTYGTMSLNRHGGERAPMLMSALGLAYLAFSEESFVDTLVDRLSQSANPYDSPAKDPKALKATLRAVREQGYATSNPFYLANAYQGQVGAMAVPAIAAGKPLASIVVIYHIANMDEQKAAELILPALRDVAVNVGAGLEEEYGLKKVA